MKKYIPGFLALLLIHTAFAQSLDIGYVPYTGGFGEMPTVYFKGNYYITRNNSGKKLCSKFDSGFNKVAEVVRDLKKMAPAKTPLLVKRDIVTSNNLYTTFIEFNGWARSLVFYKLNPDLSLTDRKALFTYTSRDFKDYVADGTGSGLDQIVLSEDKTKVAYIRPSDLDGKEITVVVADENLNILWKKEYTYPQPGGQKKERYHSWFNLYNFRVTNDGKTFVAMLPDSAGIKGLLFTEQGMQPFAHKNKSGISFHDVMIMQDDNTAMLLSLYGDNSITRHRLKGISSSILNLNTGSITDNGNLVFDEALFAGFKPDDDKKIVDVSYIMEVLPRTGGDGYCIKLSRIEYREKTSTKYISEGNSAYSTYSFPVYTNKLVIMVNKTLDKVGFSHPIACNYVATVTDQAYSGGIYLVKNNLISIDRGAEPGVDFSITLISPDGVVKKYSSGKKTIPDWRWTLNVVENPDYNGLVIRADDNLSGYGFISLHLY